MAERIAAALSAEEETLLTVVQASLPVTPRPFLALGERLGLSEQAVIALLSGLRASGTIRKIGPVFEPAALGLATELGAAEVAPARLSAVTSPPWASVSCRATSTAYSSHGLITSGFSQIASAPARNAIRMCASCR